MITEIIFVVVLILPNGEFATKSAVVETCPSVKMIGDYYEKRLKSGEIRDWNATCFNMQFTIKEPT